jgi:histidinol-phosphatase (PHP family)
VVDTPRSLPADSHVHSEWSWDTMRGSMDRTCARAVQLGLPALAFTEHVDHTVWTVDRAGLEPGQPLAVLSSPAGVLTPPPFDAAGYLAAIEDCRRRYPDLRILSGMEVGEPHRHAAAVADLLGAGDFDRVLGSLHCLPDGGEFREPADLFSRREAARLVRDYLAEVARLVAGSDVFAVLAHIDYPVRSWPAEAGRFDPAAFEDEFRHALRLLAGGGRALEVNTGVPLAAEVVGWWRDEGGTAVTFGSDAHEPVALAGGFAEAVAVVEAHGFRAGRHAYDVWRI